MKKKQKLELTWIGKEKTPKLEPRILLEEPEKSYHAAERVSENDIFDNKLIFGDNLLALKSLEQEYAGKVKCIYIDPPYNTGNAFEQYDDGIEHSIWLGLMRDRLELLKRLMSDDGSLWITIDDNEAHYLKVLCDEVFGRDNFITNVIWQKKYTVANDAKFFSDTHDHILVYSKNRSLFKLNKLERPSSMNDRYKNPDKHPKGPWKATPLHAKSGSKTAEPFKYTFNNGVVFSPPSGTYPRYSKDSFLRMDEGNEIWFGKDGTAIPSRKTFLCDLKDQGVTPTTLWLHEDVGHNHQAKEEVKPFNSSDVFDTPKPEKLMQRIVHLASNPGDIVLDSFAGSGSTAAAAHKMGRKWIMVELGEHCHTHIVPRLQKVIDGTDQGGISKAVNWKGGGGFRYYHLAPSLLEKDRWGRLVINDEFNPAMLAEAMCKMMGFAYAPSEKHYWAHGHSTESDFIYVTTQTLDQTQLQAISEEVGEKRSLLVCCSAFRAKQNVYANLTLKKIPNSVLKKCEWGKDDYSLNVQNLPASTQEEKETNLFGEKV